MAITLKRMFTKPVTEFYPYQKKELPKRARMSLAHFSNEDGTRSVSPASFASASVPITRFASSRIQR